MEVKQEPDDILFEENKFEIEQHFLPEKILNNQVDVLTISGVKNELVPIKQEKGVDLSITFGVDIAKNRLPESEEFNIKKETNSFDGSTDEDFRNKFGDGLEETEQYTFQINRRDQKLNTVVGNSLECPPGEKLWHMEDNLFKCAICFKLFPDESQLKKHSICRTKERQFKCEICPKSYSNEDNLIGHMRIHTGEKPFKCVVCSTYFSKKSNLTRHSRTHTGEKPYKCEICCKCFADKHGLVIHTRLHTGEKPFKCAVCFECFPSKPHLKVHSRSHAAEESFECKICWKHFSQRKYLNQHLLLHTRENLFKCEACSKSFKMKYYLKRHLCSQE